MKKRRMTEALPMTSYVNCRAYAFDSAARTYTVREAFSIEDGRFISVGEPPVGISAERIDLGGATVVAAFADCHVHLADTGYTLGSRDLSGVRDAAGFARAVAALPQDEAYLFAGRYDDASWPRGEEAGAAPLERYHAARFIVISRVDGHSSLLNARTFAELALEPDLSGIERDPAGRPTGRLFGEANWVAQSRFVARLPASARRAGQARAAEAALANGAVHLHAQLLGCGSRAGYAEAIASLRALPAVKIHPKICEREPELAASFGLPYVGGDVFLDGSLGSGTAATCAPYADRAGNGTLALEDGEVERYFGAAERCGVSAGVHAIGDRAIEQCLATWERVLGNRPSPRNRHFIEHFELATPEQIERAARLGLYLSMQPQFQATWGGPGGMYETRLGPRRAASMNALRSVLRAGATLCGGDDSPVCALEPLAGMAAACVHGTAAERLEPLEALTMYTYDAARFGHAEGSTGALAAGLAADFVVLDRDPFASGTFAGTRVLSTWSDGLRVYAAAR
jgi:predicted amidohydrolase YtcJ